MKKFLTSLSIIAICAMALDISMLSVQNQRLKNKLGDANLIADIQNLKPESSLLEMTQKNLEQAQVVIDLKEANYKTLYKLFTEAAEYRDQLMKEHGKCLTEKWAKAATVEAVNEKQGAHTFVYVEADSWVDLSNGEKVPAARKIAPSVDIDPNPKARWQSGPPTLNTLIFTNIGYWKDINGSFIFEPQSSVSADIGTIIRGTGGWNQ